MKIAQSKLTARGRVSIPAKVQEHLGAEPGSVLEWHDDGDRVVIRRAIRYSSEDIHRALFAKPPQRSTVDELQSGIRQAVTKSRGNDVAVRSVAGPPALEAFNPRQPLG